MTDIYKYDDGDPIFLDDIQKLSDEQKEQMRTEYRRRVQDLKDTFSTPAGERVLIYLMYEMYLFRDFKQHNAGAYAMEGKREIANGIIDMVGADFVLERIINVKKTKGKTDE